MGGKESKQFPLTYDEAIKRVTETEKRRLQDAFKRLSAPSGVINKTAFIQGVLGDGVPQGVAEKIFTICGAGTSINSAQAIVSSHHKGLTFRDTLTLLVLLTRGTNEEKTKFIYGLLCSESDNLIDRGHLEKIVPECDQLSGEISVLFMEGNKVNYETFSQWIDTYPDALGISKWILGPKSSLALHNKMDTPTFYQTLAGVTHLEEQEIVQLEKRFWSLSSNSNQVNIDVIKPLVSPPLPSVLVQPLFDAFDENKDGHIDFKELSCGVSAACRGPDLERQKFCFKIFDIDRDGRLNRSEVVLMLTCMIQVQMDSLEGADFPKDHEIETMADQMFKNADDNEESRDYLSIEDYLVWCVTSDLPKAFAKLLFQLCHIVLGLRPQTRTEEGEIVRGWLEREEKGPLSPGTVWYVISMDWWSQWHSYVNEECLEEYKFRRQTTGSEASSSTPTPNGDDPSGRFGSLTSVTSNSSSTLSPSPKPPRKNSGPTRPGIIENVALVQSLPYKVPSLTGEGGKLKTNVHLQQGKDYELIPERLWKALQQWYGSSLPLPRQVIRNSSGDLELELNPPSIKLLKHQSVPRPAQAPTVVGGYSAAALHVTGAAFGVPTHSPTNTVTRRYHAYQGTFSRRTTVKQIEEFLSNRLNFNREDMRLWYFRDETNMKLLENDSITLEEAGFRDEDSLLVEVRSRDGTWPEEISSLVIGDRRGSVSSISPPAVPGMIGLNNLGNTCYMNAALQCVANTKILSQYFNNNCHLFELNRTNPLGMKGHIAQRFGDLVREMWAPNAKAIAPIKLRWTIGRYSSNFAGFQQQDSQELLAFLLDGLHEDLNRVTEKPYSELKDSDMRPDPIVAKEAWDNHVLRNKSVIVDLFHGQLKSKVTCKVCSHESVRFDPFTYLSLPLPMESSVRIEIVVIRQDGSLPIKYGLSLDMESKYSDLKPALSQFCKIPHQNIILVDIVQGQFVFPSQDHQKLKGLNGSCIYAYEFYPLPDSMVKSQRQTQFESLSDIQRSTISRPPSTKSDDQGAIIEQVNVRNGSVGNVVVVSKATSGSTSEVSPSWPAQICMSGISLCFKPGNPGSGKHTTQRKSPSEANEQTLDKQTTPMKDTPLLSETKSPDASDSFPSLISHSRQSSLASTHSSESGKTSLGNPSQSLVSDDLGDCTMGIVVALHRKMMPQEVYFLSTEKYRPVLFGHPLIVACSGSTSYQDLYKSVWSQVSRLVSPLPPRDATQNHATDCDDSLGYEYPFVLKVVQRGGSWCAWCPWYRFCRGCALPCTNKDFAFGASYLAIDWDQTALHLRYLSTQEKAFLEDITVAQTLKSSTEPITLVKCLEAFTREEELGENEKYYCSSCKNHQLASKKLQIWRLPPILIVHLKRFHQLNCRWIKSHKIVDFPFHNLDPTKYLASVPQKTLERYDELKASSKSALVKAVNSFVDCNGTITENSEPETSFSDVILTTGMETDKTENANSFQEELDSIVDLSKKQNGPLPSIKSDDSPGSPEGLLRPTESFESDDIFEDTPPDVDLEMSRKFYDENRKSFRLPMSRDRQVSTSLQTHPILDNNLQDYHQHKLLPGNHPLEINYNMYAMVCHSGVLGGGHYISYAKSASGKWFCLNDSSCKEIKEDQIDKSMAYMLFYEREGLSVKDYLPQIDPNRLTPDFKDLEDDLDEFKKQCSLM